MNANKIRAKIAERGMTQGEIAKIIGISANSLSRKLLGKRDFLLSEVIALCSVLELDNPQEIFFRRKVLKTQQQSGNRSAVLGDGAAGGVKMCPTWTQNGGEQVKKPEKMTAKTNCEVISFPDRKQLEQKRLAEDRNKRMETLEKGKFALMKAMAELVEVEQLTGHTGLSQRVYIAFESILADALHWAQADAAMRKQNSQGKDG